MKVDLTGKVALVTGATEYVGHAMVLAFAKSGADVVVNSSDEEKGQKVAEEVRSLGRKCIFIKADAGEANGAEKMVAEAVSTLGKVDILINNPSYVSDKKARKPFHEIEDSQWKTVINGQLNSVYYCSKEALNNMVTRGCGKIINIVSIEGLVPVRLQCASAAASGGVVHLTKTIAIEMAPKGINVNAILIGSIAGEEAGNSLSGIMSHVPQKRPGTPGEIADAALFLASDASSYLNGSIITMDGAWSSAFTRDW